MRQGNMTKNSRIINILDDTYEEFKFHSNMFKTFTEKELELLLKVGSVCGGKDGIDFILISNDAIVIEIYTGDMGSGKEVIIELLEEPVNKENYPHYLSKTELWNLLEKYSLFDKIKGEN